MKPLDFRLAASWEALGSFPDPSLSLGPNGGFDLDFVVGGAVKKLATSTAGQNLSFRQADPWKSLFNLILSRILGRSVFGLIVVLLNQW